jgi:hypothetical protein
LLERSLGDCVRLALAGALCGHLPLPCLLSLTFFAFAGPLSKVV